MCGIIGLHLRNPELHPRLGALLTGMLCEMADRGSDSAGVAVYGDPTFSPQGRACVSVLECTADAVRAALADVAVTQLGETVLVTADTTPEALRANVAAALPDAL